MLKIFGLICIVLAGAVSGAAASNRLKIKRDLCREIRSFLLQISSLIRYRGLNVYEIVSELKQIDIYTNLNFLTELPDSYTPGEDFHQQWNKAVSSDKSIGGEERELLLSFGSVIGTSDIDGQLASIEAASESAKIIELRRNEEYSKKGKLFRSVGILFGIMTGILLI